MLYDFAVLYAIHEPHILKVGCIAILVFAVCSSTVGLDHFSEFGKVRPDVCFRWLDQELAVVLAKIPSEEVESVPYMRYFGFFRREDESPL